MASVQLLKVTRDVDVKVMGVVRGEVQDVGSWHQDSRCRGQIRPGQPFVDSLTISHRSENSDSFTGKRLRAFSDGFCPELPPDPSVN
jgi:hypothetical protein